MKVAWILIALLAPCLFAQSSDIPVVSVCDALKNRELHNGKPIILVGKLMATEEGIWLSQDNCEKLVTANYTWNSLVSLTGRSRPVPLAPDNFGCDAASIRSVLTEVQTTTKLTTLPAYNYAEKWYAVFGRFETRVPLRLFKYPNGSVLPYGFGHLNGSPAQLTTSPTGDCTYPER